MITHQHPNSTTVRTALFNITCDIPASHKVSGFTSHNSTRACNKCTRQFTCFEGTMKLNYSGHTLGEQHTKEMNARAAEQWLQAPSNAARQRLEHDMGTLVRSPPIAIL